MVPIGQVYGGKLCAALDRQHPRDLFDVKYLFANEGITEEIKIGFLLYLLGASRPIHEILAPHYKDQRKAFENQFQGMTAHPFSYQEFEQTRKRLIREIQTILTDQDKQLILSFQNCEPQWVDYDFRHFPAIQWKLQNLHTLKTKQSSKFLAQRQQLRLVLENSF